MALDQIYEGKGDGGSVDARALGDRVVGVPRGQPAKAGGGIYPHSSLRSPSGDGETRGCGVGRSGHGHRTAQQNDGGDAADGRGVRASSGKRRGLALREEECIACATILNESGRAMRIPCPCTHRRTHRKNSSVNSVLLLLSVYDTRHGRRHVLAQWSGGILINVKSGCTW